jgi:hypothetical protein
LIMNYAAAGELKFSMSANFFNFLAGTCSLIPKLVSFE